LIAPSDGKAMLIWDNTYSKMLNKQLSYVVKVIESHDFESAQKVCSLKEKEKQVISLLQLPSHTDALHNAYYHIYFL
jgi:hypothetical protein